MRFIWITALKDWWRHRRDPVGLIIWIGVPILIGGLITAVSGGRGGVKPKAKVLVVDQDQTFVSNIFVNATSQIGGMVDTEEVELESGQQRVNNGDATALLIIPAGFGQAVIEEEATTLTLLTNPAQTILPGIVEEGVSIFVDGTFYLHRVLGEEVREILSGPALGSPDFDGAQLTEVSTRVSAIVGRLDTYLFPPSVAVTAPPKAAEEKEDEGPPITMALLFLPSMLFMSLLFMAQGFSIDLWRERDEHTLRRVVVSPQSSVAFVAGKLLGSAGIVFLVSSVALCVGYLYFQLNLALLPLAILWCVLSGIMLSVLMMVIQMFVSSQRAGSVLTMALIFPLMMAGGSFFPFEAMPDWMAAAGKWTPNGWALVQLKDILYDRVDTLSLTKAFGFVTAVSMALFILGAQRLRTHFVQV